MGGVGDTVSVGYDRVSLHTWAVAGVLALMVGIGMVTSGTNESLGRLLTGAIIAPAGALLLTYVMTRYGQTKFLIDPDGLHDCRWRNEVVVPWSSVENVRFFRAPGGGRRQLAVAVKEQAVVSDEWPYWMRKQWRFQGRGVLISDWLASTTLDDIANAIRSHLRDDAVFQPDPTLGEVVEDLKVWWRTRRSSSG